jgi:hypothetical protein
MSQVRHVERSIRKERIEIIDMINKKSRMCVEGLANLTTDLSTHELGH